MNNSSTSHRLQMECDAKANNKKIEQDMVRMCPSKLSRRELEDLYFTLLDNNIDLKRTINKQNDKIKILSTKVQRLSAGRIENGKDCCSSKAQIKDLNDTITELRKTNDGLGERIRSLNMRLCSAKQFLTKTCSHQKNNCFSATSSSAYVKDKTNRSNSPITAHVPSRDVVSNSLREESITQPTTDEIPKEKVGLCNANRCKITVEELRQTIANLQMELASSRAEYSSRLGRLEGEVQSVRQENVSARADNLTHQQTREELLERLTSVHAKTDDLEAQLLIEKRKVLEMETRLKLTDMSAPLAKSISQLTAKNEPSTEKQLVPAETPQKPIPTRDKKAHEKPKRELKAAHPIKTQIPKYEHEFAIREPKGYTQTSHEVSATLNQKKKSELVTGKTEAIKEVVPTLPIQESSTNLPFQGAGPSKLESSEDPAVLEFNTKGDDRRSHIPTYLAGTYQEEAKSPATSAVPLKEDFPCIPYQEAKQKSITGPAVLMGKQKFKTQGPSGFPVQTPILNTQGTPFQMDDRSIPFKEAKQQFESAPPVPIQEQKIDTQAHQPTVIQLTGSSVSFQRVNEEIEATSVPLDRYDLKADQSPFQVNVSSIPLREPIDKKTKATVPCQEAKLGTQVVKDIPLPEPSDSRTTKCDCISTKTTYEDNGAYDVAMHESSPDFQTSAAIPVVTKRESYATSDFPFQPRNGDLISSKNNSHLDTGLRYVDHGFQIHELTNSQRSCAIPEALKNKSNDTSDEDKTLNYQIGDESVSKEPPLFCDLTKIIETKEREATKEKSDSESPSSNSLIIRLIDINPLINEVPATAIPFQESKPVALPKSQKETESQATSAVSSDKHVPFIPYQEAKKKSVTGPTILKGKQTFEIQGPCGVPVQTPILNTQGTPFQMDDRSIPFKEAKQQVESAPPVPIQEQKIDTQAQKSAAIQLTGPSVSFQRVNEDIEATYEPLDRYDFKADQSPFQVNVPSIALREPIDKKTKATVPCQEAKLGTQVVKDIPLPEPSDLRTIKCDCISSKTTYEDNSAEEATSEPIKKYDNKADQAQFKECGPSIPLQKPIDNEPIAKQATLLCQEANLGTQDVKDIPEPSVSRTSKGDTISSKTTYQDNGAYDIAMHESSPDSETSAGIVLATKRQSQAASDFPLHPSNSDLVSSKNNSYQDTGLRYLGHSFRIHERTDSQTSRAIPEAVKRELTVRSGEDRILDYQFRNDSVSKEPLLFYDSTKTLERKEFEEAKLQPITTPFYIPTQEQKQRLEVPSTSSKKRENELKLTNADDSGYVDQEPQKDDEMLRINRVLLKKISDLRSQLDLLIIATAGAINKTTLETVRQNESHAMNSDEESVRGFRNTKFNEMVSDIDSDEVLHKLQKSSLNIESELPVSITKEMRTSTVIHEEKPSVSQKRGKRDEFSDENITTIIPHLMYKSASKSDVFKELPLNEDETKKPLLKKTEDMQRKSPTLEEMKNLRFDSSTQLENSILTSYPKEEQPRQSETGKHDDYNRSRIPGPFLSQYPTQSERKPKDKKLPEEKTVKIVSDTNYEIHPKEPKKPSVQVETDDKITTFLNNLQERRKSKGLVVGDEEIDRDRYKQESEQTKRGSYTKKSRDERKSVDSNFINCTDIVENKQKATKYVNAFSQVKEDTIAACWQGARVCSCPLRASSAPPLRTCSGVLCVLPPATPTFNYCSCVLYKPPTEERRISALSTKSELQPQATVLRNVQHAQTQVEEPTSSHPLYTYTQSRCSRPTSPDNTEREILSLPDLPDEKEVKRHRENLSSGEKGTLTRTETRTLTDDVSFSEGEVAVCGSMKLPRNYNERSLSTFIPEMESTQRVEAALLAISDELTRCHKLLESQKYNRMEKCKKQDSDVSYVPLRPSDGTQRLAGPHHVCVFTLHVGTLVLSDEAVLNFRNKSLVLMWKYFNQSVTMTRMRAGRVVLLDFSTEYNVVFSEDFLKYMKHEKLPLLICEMNKQDEPLASCSLPLRDALLHLNRRADMSLALVPGGKLGPGTKEEVGVLDLWCLLRCDSTVTRNVAVAIARSSQVLGSGRHQSTAKSYSRLLEEDFSNERLSQDLDLGLSTGTLNKKPTPLYTYPTQAPDPKSIATSSKRRRRRSSNTSKSSNVSSNSGRKENHDSNEWVSKRINAQRNGLTSAAHKSEQHESRIGKYDDNISQGQSSVGSVRSQTRKSQLARLNYLKKYYPPEPIDSLQDLLKENEPTKDRKQSYIPKCELVPPEDDKMDEVSHISQKYKDISKLLGINKIIEAKKQVKYSGDDRSQKAFNESEGQEDQSIDITVLWLALNEECDAMVNPNIKRLYVAYNFLGRSGAELETPVSLPKPKHYVDKCYFNFKKTFNLHECDLIALGHMASVRSGPRSTTDPHDCLIFTVVSEPPEDPLGLSSCEDVGYAYLYLGDILAYSGGSNVYTEVVAVHAARGAAVCGVLAIRIDGLQVLRRAHKVSNSTRDMQ